MKTIKLLCVLFITISLNTHSQIPQIKWWYDVHDSSFGNSAMADIDSDGKPEVVFSCYRSDSTLYALNAEDGSLLWKYNTGGCNDVAPIIYDVDMDDTLEVVLPSSCVPKTFCFNGSDGSIEWVTTLHGSDSPPTIADIDNDGKPEILHGNFSGWMSCLNGEDGSVVWDEKVSPDSWIQTAPTILDADNDGDLDFVVANWSFIDDDKIFCFQADSLTLLWECTLPTDYMYHGAAVADIDGDSLQELAIGTYDGTLLVLNAEDGSLKWDYSLPSPQYIGAPVSIADLNKDQHFELVFFDWYRLHVLDYMGNLLWDYNIPAYGQPFRGAAISDVNGDDTLDVVFGTSKGDVMALHGKSGNVLWTVDLAAHHDSSEFDIDHGPVIADMDQDGLIDIFLVGGRTTYPDTLETNYGRAYCISAESPGGPDWPMFRRNIYRTATVPLGDSSLSFSENKNMDHRIELYPNPATSFFVVELTTDRLVSVKISMKDIQGRTVSVIYNGVQSTRNIKYRTEIKSIEENTISPGGYVVEIRVDEFRYIRKLVVR